MRKILVLFLGVSLAVVWVYRGPLQTAAVEKSLNLAGREFWQGPVRLQSAGLGPGFTFAAEKIQGELKVEGGKPIPFEIASFKSRGPVSGLFSREGAAFEIKGIRTHASARQGWDGVLQVKAGPGGFTQGEFTVRELGLEDLAWIDPKSLKGAAGRLEGRITFASNAQGEVKFAGNLAMEEGGTLQKRFFEALRPYLPQVSIAGKKSELVRFEKARLDMDLAESDRLKMFLHIAVLEYNLNLNLNIEVRLDEKNSLGRLMQAAGMIKGQE